MQSSVVASQQTALTNKRTIPFAQQGVTAAEEALRLTQKNLEAGTGLTLDVLTAQDAADQARLNYASSVVRYNQAEINLLAALGLLEETRSGANRRPRHGPAALTYRRLPPADFSPAAPIELA